MCHHVCVQVCMRVHACVQICIRVCMKGIGEPSVLYLRSYSPHIFWDSAMITGTYHHPWLLTCALSDGPQILCLCKKHLSLSYLPSPKYLSFLLVNVCSHRIRLSRIKTGTTHLWRLPLDRFTHTSDLVINSQLLWSQLLQLTHTEIVGARSRSWTVTIPLIFFTLKGSISFEYRPTLKSMCPHLNTLIWLLWVEEGRKFYSSTRTCVSSKEISTAPKVMHSDLHHPSSLAALLNSHCWFLSLTASNLDTQWIFTWQMHKWTHSLTSSPERDSCH